MDKTKRAIMIVTWDFSDWAVWEGRSEGAVLGLRPGGCEEARPGGCEEASLVGEGQKGQAGGLRSDRWLRSPVVLWGKSCFLKNFHFHTLTGSCFLFSRDLKITEGRRSENSMAVVESRYGSGTWEPM